MAHRTFKAGTHRLTWSDDRNAYVVHNSELIAWWDRSTQLWIVTNEDHIDLPTEYAANRRTLPSAINAAIRSAADGNMPSDDAFMAALGPCGK